MPPYIFEVGRGVRSRGGGGGGICVYIGYVGKVCMFGRELRGGLGPGVLRGL